MLKILIIRETTAQSIARDAGTVISAWAMILPGWYLGSTILSAVGAVIFVVWLASRIADIANPSRRLTIDQARAELDRIEADQ